MEDSLCDVPYATVTSIPSSLVTTFSTNAGRGFGPGLSRGRSGNLHQTMSPGSGAAHILPRLAWLQQRFLTDQFAFRQLGLRGVFQPFEIFRFKRTLICLIGRQDFLRQARYGHMNHGRLRHHKRGTIAKRIAAGECQGCQCLRKSYPAEQSPDETSAELRVLFAESPLETCP